MKKRFLALFLAFALIGTTACSGPGTQGASSGQPSGGSQQSEQATGDKVLKFWTINKDKATVAVMEKAAKNFQDKTGVKVEMVFTENDPYKTKLKTVMGSGEAPDIFHSWGGGWLEQFVKEDQVLDITDMVTDFKDELPAASWELDTFDGKVYAVPYALSGTALFYNKEMFDKYGLTFPKTWSEMENVAKTLKSNGVIPFALGNKSKWPGCLAFIYLSMRLGGGEVYVNALARNGKSTFEDPSYIEAGKMIQKMVDDGWYPEGANGINYDTGGSRMLFYTEKCGMILQTTGFVANCKNENREFYDKKLGIGAYPTIEGGKGKADEVLCGNNAYSVSKNSKYAKEAVEFLKYFTTDPEINAEMANDAGILVALKSAKVDDEKLKQAIDIQVNSSYMQNFYDQGLPTEMGELHKDTTQAIFGKTMTPEEAAQKMEAKAKELLG